MKSLFTSVPRNLLLGLLLSAAPAAAQTQLILTSFHLDRPLDSDHVVGVDLVSGTVRWKMVSFRPPLDHWHVFGAAAISGDGRFAVWPALTGLLLLERGYVVRDLISGEIVKLFARGLSGEILITHPRLQRLYAHANSTLLVIDSAGVRQVTTCAAEGASITLDGDELFIACSNRILVVDTMTETVTRTIATTPGVTDVKVSADGTRVVAFNGRLSGMPSGEYSLALFDGTTGEHLRSATLPPPPDCCREIGPGALHINADRNEVYVALQFYGYVDGVYQQRFVTQVYDTSTLTLRATVPENLVSMAFTPDGTQAAALVSDGVFQWSSTCELRFWNPHSRTFQGDRYAGGCGFFAGIAFASPPLAPSDVEITTSGRRVSFAWQLIAQSPAATSYAIDASLQPGGPVIATVPTGSDQLTFTIDNVPPGTYYVRVRAINAMGSSPPSSEQRVVVP